MNWDYIAGFFDGEGNISIKKRAGRRPQVVINITQKRRDVLDQIVEFLGREQITSHIYQKNGPIFYIQISQAQSCKPFLKSIIQSLIVKKEESEIGLATLLSQSQSRTRLSISEKERILKLRNEGKSYAFIGSALNRDSSNIFRAVKRLAQEVLPL